MAELRAQIRKESAPLDEAIATVAARRNPPMTDTGPNESELAEWDKTLRRMWSEQQFFGRNNGLRLIAALRAERARAEAAEADRDKMTADCADAIEHAKVWQERGQKAEAKRDAAIARAKRAEAALRDAINRESQAMGLYDAALTPAVQGGEEPPPTLWGLRDVAQGMLPGVDGPAQPGAAEE